ncbi:proteoglycan 4 isoform X27 [Rana temporaria]|uniref:proteoglycan 4 isoform X27 n=1 Tax=Rana temporaria TaxID=8407 RepID=UPI001AACECA9|nr:proteoglycan 4 isoform X27 [Rana temporaria]
MLNPQLLLCFTLYFSVVSAQSEGSCVGRCGQGYFRGDPCHCDYTCMTYMECCLDYKTVCTTEGSCQGRCHEGFIRGQTCDCDSSCVGYGKCCPDYEEHCAKPVQRQSPPRPSPQLPDPDPRDNSPKPSMKPEERVPEPAPEESEDNVSSSSFSSSSSSSSVKGSKKSKKLSRKNQMKKKPQDEDDILDPDNPGKKIKPKDKDGEPNKPKSPKTREGDDDPDKPEIPPKEPNQRNPNDKGDKPKKNRGPTSKERDDDAEGPDKNPKEPNQRNPNGKGDKPKEPRGPTSKERGDDAEGRDKNSKEPNQRNPNDKGDKPKEPRGPTSKERGDDVEGRDKNPKEPNQRNPNDKGDKPKEPRGPTSKERGDDGEGRDKNPKEPNQKNPNDKGDKPKEPRSPTSKEIGDDGEGRDKNPKDQDDKDGKPKKPKVKNGDDPEDPDSLPKERLPKSPKDEDDKPQKTKTSKVIENTEEETEQDENNEENTSFNSLKNTRKRSPANANKRPKKPNSRENADDSPRKPLPSDKRKKNPTDNKPNKKKKVNPEDDADDESPKPGKGKNPKKKPSPKDTVKRKKKVDSEEERQETVSEFSSSSQSSSSHSRSKSIRRKTGKNKKNLKEKKKFPEEEEPEDPLMPPKKKHPLPTPVYTTPDEGSGDGSGMDFLQTTILSTTKWLNTTTNMATTVGTKITEGTLKPSINPQTDSINGSSSKTTTNIPIPESTEKQSAGSSATTVLYAQSSTHKEKTKEPDTTTGTTPQQMSTLKTPQDQSTADSNAKHTTPKLEGTAVTTPRLEGTAVTTPGLEGTAVTTSRLEGTAVTTSRLEGTAVTTSRLEGTAVTTPGLKGTAVTTSRLDGSAVTTPGLEGTAVQHKSTPKGPTKHTPGSGLTTTSSHSSPGKDSGTSPKTQTMDRSTNKMDEYSTTAPFTTRNPNESKSQTSTNPTTRHADDIITKDTAETTTTGQSVKLTTRQPDMDQTTKQPGQRPIPGEGSSYEATTKQSPNAKTTSIPRRTTTAPNQKDSFTTMPINKDDIETNKTTTPHTIHPHHICNLLKDEAISLRIPESDLKLITEICAEMQQQYPNINIPSLQTRQPNIDKRKIHPEYPLSEGTPNFWYQPPGSKLIQIIEEIYRRIYISPTTNLTGIPGQDNHRSTAWLLLINKIKRAIDPQMNLCVGPPADGMTTLQNGSMVVFRGHYFWTLNQGGATEMPRKISEVWGIPSPIDTVFTRCNCGGKTFFFKGPRYWRFTNDAMDKGYPKEIIKGFGGLGGKVTAVLSVSGIKTRPESVYFFKPGGNVQKYTFRQEQTKRCTKKKQPSVNYPIYSQRVQTVKFRFPRDIVRHRIEIRRTFTNIPQPLGILHKERSVRSTWRGIPSNIVSAVSLPNPQKQDGFDYFVFTKDKYYNINMSSKVAMKPPAEAEQKTTKDFYKCKE